MAKYAYRLNNVDTDSQDWALRLAQDGFQSIVAGTQQLGTVGDLDTLAILAHGTAEPNISVKQGGKRSWTASELAQQLEDDGLRHSHRVIELIVCEAASSTNTVKNAAELAKLRNKFNQTNNAATKDKVAQKYGQVATAVPVLINMNQWTTKHLLPFAASLVHEMKVRQYDYIRVIGYKYCVSSHFTEGKVWLQHPVDGDRKAREEDKVQWL